MSVRIGLAISTLGRASLSDLLGSVAGSSLLPVAVAVADHTPGRDLQIPDRYPFPVLVVPSTGGASQGRNDAAAALSEDVDVLGFPNDDNRYTATTLARAAAAFEVQPRPSAVAGTLLETSGPRFRLPPDGQVLNRRTAWRAIEPALFVDRAAFLAAGGFRQDLGSGADTPWQSGDGTDVLLTMMRQGGQVHSRPNVVVLGTSERKGLPEQAWIAKQRAYARGTGYVYRTHAYPLHSRLRVLVAPLVKPTLHDPSVRLSVRLAGARFLGRLEGLLGRVWGDDRPQWL